MKSSMVGCDDDDDDDDFGGLSDAAAAAISSNRGIGGAVGSSRTDLRAVGIFSRSPTLIEPWGSFSTFSSYQVPVWLSAEIDMPVEGLSSIIPSPYRGSSSIGAGVLTCCEGKYEPSWVKVKSVSSRERFREGFVEMGVVELVGVQEVELLRYDSAKEEESLISVWSEKWIDRKRLAGI